MEEEKKKGRRSKNKNKDKKKNNNKQHQQHNDNNSKNKEPCGYEGEKEEETTTTANDEDEDEDATSHPINPLNANGGVGISSPLPEADKSLCRHREAALEGTIKQLQIEIQSHVRKQATSESMIKQLQDEKDSSIKKAADFEETIRHLRDENEVLVQNQTGLEMKFVELQYERDSLLQKQASWEEKVNLLLDEKAFLISNMMSLEEKVKELKSEQDSWIITENSAQETIGKMKVAVARLQMQVVELEESRDSLIKGNQELMATIVGLEESRDALLKDKQKLMDSISNKQLQLQNLETCTSSANRSDEGGKCAVEQDVLISQIEAASALVDKLIMENAELVEKVNELCVKLNQRGAVAGMSLAIANDVAQNSEIANATVGPLSDMVENAALSSLEYLEKEPAGDVQLPSESEYGEIVQIASEDDKTLDVDVHAGDINEKDDVPLSDAPLIGAPFRLISFVAKYVSGDDLVNKDTLT